jgi:DNA-binding MarR family transcriptional regulator
MYNTYMSGEKKTALHVTSNTASNDLFRLIRFFSRRPIRVKATKEVELSHIWVTQAVDAATPRNALATIGWVATYSNIDTSTASRLVNGTLKMGLVRRVVVQNDARTTALELTASGRSLIQNVQEYQRTIFDNATDDWEASDRAVFAQLFTRFVENLLNQHANSSSSKKS